MKETTLWNHLRPVLEKRGHFQKISDRFTGGIPDVLGCCDGIPVAIELKEFSGVNTLRVRFRPGQLDWLRDWNQFGGVSLILSTHGQTLYAHRWPAGALLEKGASVSDVEGTASMVWKKPRGGSWKEGSEYLLEVIRQEYLLGALDSLKIREPLLSELIERKTRV